METNSLNEYKIVRGNGAGFFEQKRGFIEVSGAEAEMFLNGLITNNAAALESFHWMRAAFPNAQGRLLAVVRVLRLDGKFLFETEEATHEKVFQNLFRFTFAGDFKVEDLTGKFSCLSIRGKEIAGFEYEIPSENEVVAAKFDDGNGFIIRASHAAGIDVFALKTQAENFKTELLNAGLISISAETREVLRVENGEPLYGVDADETTIVPEIGLPDLISYNKGCYIGQEIIARIHFRGHVAKKLTGLIFENKNVEIKLADEIKSADGKNAGRITSVAFSPKLETTIALGYVRYDFLAEGTILKVNDCQARVKDLPFIN